MRHVHPAITWFHINPLAADHKQYSILILIQKKERDTMNQQNIPYVPPVLPHNSTTALISLISGIAGVTVVPVIGSIVAIITGHMAKSEIKRGAGMITGNGMATAGLILGYGAIALGICITCVLVILPLLGIGLSIPFLNSGSTY
jgi:hypothetical protein